MDDEEKKRGRPREPLGARGVMRGDHNQPTGILLPPAPPAALDMPADLPPDARAFWNEHAARAAAVGLLNADTREQFIELCRTYAELTQTRRTIAAEGAIIEYPNGTRAKHPLTILLTKTQWRYDKLLARFSPKNKIARTQPEQNAAAQRAWSKFQYCTDPAEARAGSLEQERHNRGVWRKQREEAERKRNGES